MAEGNDKIDIDNPSVSDVIGRLRQVSMCKLSVLDRCEIDTIYETLPDASDERRVYMLQDIAIVSSRYSG